MGGWMALFRSPSLLSSRKLLLPDLRHQDRQLPRCGHSGQRRKTQRPRLPPPRFGHSEWRRRTRRPRSSKHEVSLPRNLLVKLINLDRSQIELKELQRRKHMLQIALVPKANVIFKPPQLAAWATLPGCAAWLGPGQMAVEVSAPGQLRREGFARHIRRMQRSMPAFLAMGE